MRCLRELAERRPNDIAFSHLLDGPSRQAHITYSQLDRQARSVAATLQSRGLAGENIVLAYPSGLEFIAAYFGVLYAGCIAVPTCQPRHRSMDAFRAMASDCHAAVALGTTAAITQFKSVTGAGQALEWIATDQSCDGRCDSWSEPAISVLDTAMIQYTSGSTSAPKGVMLSHANLMANAGAISSAFAVNGRSSSVFWLPAYHDMGLIGGVLVPVFSGVPSTVIAPTMFLQNPFLWLEAISKSGATISGGPNFAFDLCVRRITAEQRATLDLSNWGLAFIGAEAVQAETLERFTEAFAPCGFRASAFYPCYGQAEATLMVTGPTQGTGAAICAFSDDALAKNRVEPQPDAFNGARHARRLVGCGSPVGDLRVEIVEPETQTAVGLGRIGEIWVAGESVAKGYWQNPKRVAATFNGRLVCAEEEPFLRTGDLGFIHDGQLYVTGRVDDLIIVRGLNHHPQDIELTARRSHPLLEQGLGAAFVMGEGNAQRLVLVHEVARESAGGDDLGLIPEIIRAAVLEEHGLTLHSIMLMRRGTVSRTTSGKVQRRACRTAFLANELNPITRDDMPLATMEAVYRHAATVSRLSAGSLSPETPIRALALDSLQRVELLALLEREYGKKFSYGLNNPAGTLGELAAAALKCREQIGQPIATSIDASQHTVELFPEYLDLKRQQRTLCDAAGFNPYFPVDRGAQSPTIVASGKAHIAGNDLVNFGVYDYLGMSRDPAVIGATKAALDRYGTSAGASRLVSGEKQIHGELENALAAFLGTPAAIVFVSGHATNVTTIGHLFGPGDLVVHDALIHNSVLQGAKLSGAACRGFPHNDWQALDTLLAEIRHGFRRVLIAVEGVYSMDGDYPDLARFIAVKQKHGAMLLVDEAHSLGTMGDTGRGIGEYAGVGRDDVDLWMGTLSKTLGSCGGYVAGSAALVEYLKYTAPGFVYSVGLSPSNAAAALASLELLMREPQRVSRLRDLSAHFMKRARASGLNTGLAGGTPVIPVIIGDTIKCLRLSKALFDRGINVQPILHPAVAEQATRLRFFVTTHHTESIIRGAVDAVARELARL